jgi:hypothetical protein
LVNVSGRELNNTNEKEGQCRFFREFSIPDPVTFGLIFSLLSALLCLVIDVEISFDLGARLVVKSATLELTSCPILVRRPSVTLPHPVESSRGWVRDG